MKRGRYRREEAMPERRELKRAKFPGSESTMPFRKAGGSTWLYVLATPLFFAIIQFLLQPALAAREKPKGPPPARVTVTEVKTGLLAPRAAFIGTVYYREVSDCASEVSGLVKRVGFEEGERVKKGQILVKLTSDLLRKSLQATRASYEQVLAELKIARINLERKKRLYRKKSISKQLYDDARFQVIGLEKQAASLKAQVDRGEIELQKKKIRAPFDGVVVERQVDEGEWVSEGKTVAVVARDNVIDIIAEVPERYIRFIKPGMKVEVMVNDMKVQGKVVAVIPRGAIATRTFPVKIRASNTGSFMEGMSARVTLPTAKEQNVLLVPRDAVVTVSGRPVVFAVMEGQASMIPVRIVGYAGSRAGIEANGLKDGMLVVLQGNERLRNGQMLSFQPSQKKKSQ